MRYFLVSFQPGPGWRHDADVFGQPLDGHLEYIHGLYAAGLILMAGPLADGSGGMTVVQCDSPDEAAQLMGSDPAVHDGVLVPEVREWRPIAWDFEPGGRTPYETGRLRVRRQH